MTYTIGLPPNHISYAGGSSKNFMKVKDNYLKIIIKPIMPNQTSLLEAVESMVGKINLEPAAKEWVERMNALLSGSGGGVGDTLIIRALSEGPFTESYGNSLQNITMLGQMSEFVANSKVGTIAASLKAAGLNIDTVTGSFNNKNIDKAGKIVQGVADAAQNQKKIESGLNRLIPNIPGKKGIVKTTGVLGSHIAQLLAGNKPIFPLLWFNSSFSCGYNFSVRLYNPNPANSSMHESHIVRPLVSLLPFVLPYNDKKGTTYSSPLYMKIYSKGLFNIPAAMISNLSIVRGGDDNAIAFNGRPSIIDVRFSISPVYDKRLLYTSVENASMKPDIDTLLSQDGSNTIKETTQGYSSSGSRGVGATAISKKSTSRAPANNVSKQSATTPPI